MPIFEELDIKNEAHLNFFKTHNDIAGVIHFAASKAVGESVDKPLLYCENNLNTLVYMLKNILNYHPLILFLVHLVRFMVKQIRCQY